MDEDEREHREWLKSELQGGKKYTLKLPKDIAADEVGDILSSFDIAYEMTPMKEEIERNGQRQYIIPTDIENKSIEGNEGRIRYLI